MSFQAAANPSSQFLAGLEVRYPFLRNQHPPARLRTATDLGWVTIQTETPKPVDLDTAPIRQRVGHCIEDRLDRDIRIPQQQLRKAGGQLFHEFEFSHGHLVRVLVAL